MDTLIYSLFNLLTIPIVPLLLYLCYQIGSSATRYSPDVSGLMCHARRKLHYIGTVYMGIYT